MRQKLIVRRHVAPGRIVCPHRFRVARLRAVVLWVRRVGIDRVGRLLDPPPAAGNDHRILNDVSGFQRDVVPILVFLLRIRSDGLKQRDLAAARVAEADVGQRASFALLELAIFHAKPRGRSGRQQRRPFANSPMAIDAVYFNSSARFVVHHAVAVRVLPEMTIDAVHALLKMDVV